MLKESIRKINRTINFIEQNLSEDLSLTVLAKYANYSPYHFHRMFSNFKRETPQKFVQRKRIERIAWQLLKNKNQSVGHIALQYGFDNHVSFAKAFKKFYGVSASQLREQSNSQFNRIYRQNSKIGKEQIKIGDYFERMESVRQWMLANGTVRRMHLSSQFLLSIRNQGSFELASPAFHNLRKWSKENNLLEIGHRWQMVIHDNPAITEESKLQHSACISLDQFTSVDHPFDCLEIPAGYFMVGTFDLSESKFPIAWGGVGMHLVEKGHRFRDGHYFEIFHTDSLFSDVASHRVDICIPIH